MDAISWRRKAGRGAGIVLSLAFAAVLVPIATLESWTGLTARVRPGEPSPVTVRLPEPVSSDLFERPGRILVQRGEIVTADQASVFRRLYIDGKLDGAGAAAGLFVAFALIGILLTTHVRTTQRGRLLRVQGTVLTSFVVIALVYKMYLLFTPLSAFLVPAAALAVLLGLVVERNVGLGGAIALALVLSAMTPFDASVAVVLAAQGVAAVLACSRGKKRRSFLWAGVAAAGAAAGAYVGILFLLEQRLPLGELAQPFRSPLVAAITGGLLVGPLAILVRPGVEGLLGEIPKARLVELADLENPLLKQIAQKSPGTWQHSLAMANMAEGAANAIGANALLVRVGAYYHDLGKSLTPGQYIENMPPGQPSPHDAMAPEKSAEAIFSHVTEGVRLAREKGLPEAVIDFMHMHHGDGLLEYFWAKCLESGNPRKLSVKNFRYPGVKPQTRETAILAICDAVEAASRSLKQPSARSVEALVQRIVYGKLHLGQLDESGLTVAELKAVADMLVDTLKHAHHIRVEYPWQKEEAKMAAAAAATPAEALATTQPRPRGDNTQRFIVHALDSADLPRPLWNGNANDLDEAVTREMPRPRPEKVVAPLSEAAPKVAPAPAARAEPEPELFPEIKPIKPAAVSPPPPPPRDATSTTPMRAVRPQVDVTEEISEEVEPAPEPIEVLDAKAEEASSAGEAKAAAEAKAADKPQVVEAAKVAAEKPEVAEKAKAAEGATPSPAEPPAAEPVQDEATPLDASEGEGSLPDIHDLPTPNPDDSPDETVPAKPTALARVRLARRATSQSDVTSAPIVEVVRDRKLPSVATEGEELVDDGEVIPLDRPKAASSSSPVTNAPVPSPPAALPSDPRALTEPPDMIAEAEPLLTPTPLPLPPAPAPERMAAEELSADELEEIDPIEDVEDDDQHPTAIRPPFRTVGPPPKSRVADDDDQDLIPTRVAALGEESSGAKLARATLPPRANPPPRRRLPPPAPKSEQRETSDALKILRRDLDDD